MYKGSDKDKQYKLKYQKEHKRLFALNLYDTKDKLIIDHLEKNKPYNQYIKNLIVQDMEKQKDK